MKIEEVLDAGPVIPVIVLDDACVAVPMATALFTGGIKVFEITLRTPAGIEAVRAVRRALPEAIVGAGTVLTNADLLAAMDAGAQFGVSPGLLPEVVEQANRLGWPFLPGVMTPSEVMRAQALGCSALKLFPAVQAGGIDMLKALGGPFPGLRFCPTGGISVETAPGFLALPNVACVGGSWLTPKARIEAADWDGIAGLARRALRLRPEKAKSQSDVAAPVQ